MSQTIMYPKSASVLLQKRTACLQLVKKHDKKKTTTWDYNARSDRRRVAPVLARSREVYCRRVAALAVPCPASSRRPWEEDLPDGELFRWPRPGEASRRAGEASRPRDICPAALSRLRRGDTSEVAGDLKKYFLVENFPVGAAVAGLSAQVRNKQRFNKQYDMRGKQNTSAKGENSIKNQNYRNQKRKKKPGGYIQEVTYTQATTNSQRYLCGCKNVSKTTRLSHSGLHRRLPRRPRPCRLRPDRLRTCRLRTCRPQTCQPRTYLLHPFRHRPSRPQPSRCFQSDR
jgi:hypothetical protein